MKRLVLTLGLATALATSTFAGGYYGGGYHGGGGYYGGYHGCGSGWYGGSCWWPAFAFGIGLGAVATAASYASTPTYYSAPVYAYPYAQPVYVSNPSAKSTAAVAAVQDPPKPKETPAWVPATAGAGRWVPDSTPYAYNSGSASPAAAAPQVASSSVTVTQRVNYAVSSGGVRVVSVSR
jgi:hypothetical protein